MAPSNASPPPPPPPPAPGPQPSYPPSYPYPYYYTPYYPYGYTGTAAARKLEPRQLRTTQSFDLAVFANYMLGAGFAWAALVAGVAAAALIPSLAGSPGLGSTERSWLSGVMIARVVVWVVLGLGLMLSLGTLFRLHEGRSEFSSGHERHYRELQAATATLIALVGGAGLLTIILSNPIRTGFPPPADDLLDLKASLTLSAVIWGAACAAGGMIFARALVRLLGEFVDESQTRRLAIVPIIVMFIPLLHAALTVSFLNMADVTTISWDAAALHATGEAGGLAGILAVVPLVILVKAFRDAYDRIVAGEVKPASATPPPGAAAPSAPA